ncbi:preprotein translocase subunit SecG [Brucella tritici]|uniref:Protein-export membrane protein SecG n=1 Tax=Brucella tritici TaxID=94626 RepID=A0A6N6QEZ8_9HYPH|nr:preprotein translocase subunit SecG [Brucella tritici]KAB2662229.1 preprotein translocase subunit SecG [Brucella tritici]KAB2675355.1 preprotein translocase subunit SecG [Brucella tritici]KAB2682054.1 preprotein translocase subunit SecG [Brucella tritici]NKW10066.1 preprotein translocase subunit SecG [Brucella tritici]
MQTVIIVIHLLIVLALVGVVLIQRSEGGGLGIGGGSGFMTARGAANALTRTTAILAIGFFATSLILGIMARYGEKPTDILNRIPAASGSQTAPAGGNGGGILNQLGGESSRPDANQTTPGAEAPATQPDATQPQAPVVPETPANPVPSSQ